MGRFDKYDPLSGGFRAALNADYTGSPNVVAVGLNSSGRVVVGAGVAAVGIVGVIVQPANRKAGDIIDVMTDGEIVDLTGLTAGTAYTGNTTTGAVSNAAASATQIEVGFTVEASRLVVRCRRQ